MALTTSHFQAGHSVLAHITDFLPYFYVSAPRGFTEDDKQSLQDHINNQLAHPGAVRSVSIVRKRNLWGYLGDDMQWFIKLTISEPRVLPKVRGLFERGELQFQDIFTAPITTYESNIAYTLRFMIDRKVRCELSVFDNSLSYVHFR